MEKAKFGVVGMGVMGSNLALNIQRRGFPVAVFNRTEPRPWNFWKVGKRLWNNRHLHLR